MKHSTTGEEVSVVDVWHQMIKDISKQHILNIFYCLILVKEAQFFRTCLCFRHQERYETDFTAAIAAHIGPSEGHSSVYFVLLPDDGSMYRL